MSTKTADISLREDWSFEELQEEAEALRKRLNAFRTSLGRFFVAKQELIDLMVVAAVAQEPLLLVGPPGTAKSRSRAQVQGRARPRRRTITSSTC